MEEKSQIKSDLERKDKSLLDSDSEVSSLKTLLEGIKSEKITAKVAFEATIKRQGEKIVDLEKITNKIPADLLTLPAQLTTNDI